MKTALIAGLFIGIANSVWLYLTHYLHIPTNGAIDTTIWLILTVTGYFLALRAIKHQNPSLSYWSGIGAGTLAAVVSTIVSVVALIGFYTIICPNWREDAVQEVRQLLLSKSGLPQSVVDHSLEQFRNDLTLTSNLIGPATTALITGVVLSAIIMLFLRRRRGITANVTNAA